MNAPGHRTPDELLREFLADEDVPCPSCRYNLRGYPTTACPECGAELSLGLQGGRSRSAPLLLGVLLFSWIMLAGVLNFVRAAHTAYRSAEFAAPSGFVNSGPAIATPGGVIGGPKLVRPPDIFSLPWSAVTGEEWWGVIWAALLIASGAAGLVLLTRCRAGPLADRTWKYVRWLAVGAAVLYAGQHLVLFATEALRW